MDAVKAGRVEDMVGVREYGVRGDKVFEFGVVGLVLKI